MRPRFAYRAFGLDIVSDFELPELPPAGHHPRSVDLSIETDSGVAEAMPPEAEGAFHPHPDGGFVFRATDAADFKVSGGKLIRMAELPGGDPGLARLYLLGSALGMALHQRGWLVLHASAVLHAGKVTMFVGESGAGKSTLAAGFGKAGFDVLADDVLAIRMDSCGKPEVWPGARSFKLWADTLDSLGMERTNLPAIANRTDKYFVMNPRQVADQAYPLAEIVVLEGIESDGVATLDTLPRLEAIRAIADNTYRPEYVDLLARRSEHFQQCAVLAAAIPVRRFRRPWDPAAIDAGVGMLQRLRA